MPPRLLTRSRDDRTIAGVCGGIGRYLGVDPTVVRVAFAIVTLFGGAGLAAYVLAWLVIPDEGESTSIAASLLGHGRRNR